MKTTASTTYVAVNGSYQSYTINVGNADVEVYIPDDNLRSVLESALGKNADEAITEVELARLTEIEYVGKGPEELQITDLTGLEHCTSLTLLHLNNNQISDISALKELTNLNTLYLSGNQITDISALKDAKKLWSLYLGGNPLEDLTVLNGLPWLSTLELKGCSIKEISAISDPTELKYLFLQGNKIRDLQPLLDMVEKDAAGEKRFAPYLHLYVADNPLRGKARGKQIRRMKKLGVRVNNAKKKKKKKKKSLRK